MASPPPSEATVAEEEECPICYDTGGDFTALPTCGHRFHLECLIPLHVRAEFICPLCRRENQPATDKCQILKEMIATFPPEVQAMMPQSETMVSLIDTYFKMDGTWDWNDLQSRISKRPVNFDQMATEVFTDPVRSKNFIETVSNLLPHAFPGQSSEFIRDCTFQGLQSFIKDPSALAGLMGQITTETTEEPSPLDAAPLEIPSSETAAALAEIDASEDATLTEVWNAFIGRQSE